MKAIFFTLVLIVIGHALLSQNIKKSCVIDSVFHQKYESLYDWNNPNVYGSVDSVMAHGRIRENFIDFYKDGKVVRRVYNFDDRPISASFEYTNGKLTRITDHKMTVIEHDFKYYPNGNIDYNVHFPTSTTAIKIVKTPTGLKYEINGDYGGEITMDKQYKRLAYEYGNINFLDFGFSMQDNLDMSYGIHSTEFDGCDNLILYSWKDAETGKIHVVEKFKYFYKKL